MADGSAGCGAASTLLKTGRVGAASIRPPARSASGPRAPATQGEWKAQATGRSKARIPSDPRLLDGPRDGVARPGDHRLPGAVDVRQDHAVAAGFTRASTRSAPAARAAIVPGSGPAASQDQAAAGLGEHRQRLDTQGARRRAARPVPRSCGRPRRRAPGRAPPAAAASRPTRRRRRAGPRRSPSGRVGPARGPPRRASGAGRPSARWPAVPLRPGRCRTSRTRRGPPRNARARSPSISRACAPGPGTGRRRSLPRTPASPRRTGPSGR